MMAGWGEATLWGWGMNERGRRDFKHSLKRSYYWQVKVPKSLKRGISRKANKAVSESGGSEKLGVREEKESVRKK